jgi:hypothetical protein
LRDPPGADLFHRRFHFGAIRVDHHFRLQHDDAVFDNGLEKAALLEVQLLTDVLIDN